MNSRAAGCLAALSAGLLAHHCVMADDAFPYSGGIAYGEYKFLGNIGGMGSTKDANGNYPGKTESGGVEDCKCSYTDFIDPNKQNGFDVDNHFTDYWNQISPENSGKFGVVRALRQRTIDDSVDGRITFDNYDWLTYDAIYNYAQYQGVVLKEHTLVWGDSNQTPSWFGGLSQAEKVSTIEQYIYSVCQHSGTPMEGTSGYGVYLTSGHSWMIDVVNEPINTSGALGNFKTASFKLTSGATGTGWDWVVWSFEKARQYCPNAKLILNEYNVLKSGSARDQFIHLAKLLRDRNLLDGIGTQSHQFEVDNMSAADVKNGLDALATVGSPTHPVPIYITELDISGDDNTQRDRYSKLFPTMWTHPNVAGVTLWGYVEGETWKNNTHLIHKDGSERPAMQWLRCYFKYRRDESDSNCSQFAFSGPKLSDEGQVAFSYVIPANSTVQVRAVGRVGGESIRLKVADHVVGTWTLSQSWKTFQADTTLRGNVRVEFINDNGARDARVDYIRINGVVRQSESQPINTGQYLNGCGKGHGYNEWMQCDGYIDYGAL